MTPSGKFSSCHQMNPMILIVNFHKVGSHISRPGATRLVGWTVHPGESGLTAKFLGGLFFCLLAQSYQLAASVYGTREWALFTAQSERVTMHLACYLSLPSPGLDRRMPILQMGQWSWWATVMTLETCPLSPQRDHHHCAMLLACSPHACAWL